MFIKKRQQILGRKKFMDLKQLLTMSDIFEMKAFVNYVEKDWGILYFDCDNPTSHDSNHAVILDEKNFDDKIDFITNFYLSKNLTPRIYFINNQQQLYEKNLTTAGYKIYNCGKFSYFFLTGKNTIKPSNKLDIKIVTDINVIDDNFVQTIFAADAKVAADALERAKKHLRREVASEKCDLYVGYFQNQPACMASVNMGEFGLTCLDSVETAEKFYGNGFMSELISYIVDHTRQPMFLYAENPVAIHIYEKAGFREFGPTNCFRAVYEKNK